MSSSPSSSALGLYIANKVAATVASIPAGRMADGLGAQGPLRVLAAGVTLFALAYLAFAVGPVGWALLALPFIAVGCVETAEHAAVATLAATQLRGWAFGLLAAAQSLGNFVASAVAGLLWTLVSPAAAFGYLVVWMALALVGLLTAHRAAVAAP